MNEIDFIETTLESLAPYVREQFASRTTVRVQQKSGVNDLLTEVDLEVQARITREIRAQFPGDIVVAEEEGMDTLPESPDCRCWFIDPIDGTQNFVRGLFPEFGISIAFAESDAVAAGGVGMPVTGDLFLAQRGAGATRNGNAIRVSQVDDLSLARVDIDLGYPRLRETTLRRCGGLVKKVGEMRSFCAAVVGLCSVACGEADAYTNVETHPWDAAASMLIIREAGGQVTTFEGEDYSPFVHTTSIVASNGSVHAEILAHLTPA